MTKQISFPYEVDFQGKTATADEQQHIRDMIEQVLFTVPGERVNRPDFGTRLMDMVFAPASNELISATKFMVQGALQQHMNDLIQVQEVEIENNDSQLNVTVQYLTLKSQNIESVQFTSRF